MNGMIRILAAVPLATFAAAQPAVWSSRGQAAQAVLCGRTVSFDLPAAAPNDEGFVGVWSGGTWNANTCGALIVQRTDRDRAEVIYIYGPSGPHSRMPWNSLYRTALIAGNELTFRDNEGGSFSFRLNGRTLGASFRDSKGHSLHATLGKEPIGQTSEPRISGPRTDFSQPTTVNAPPMHPAALAPVVSEPSELQRREVSVIADARKENKPVLIKDFLIANPNSPSVQRLMQEYVALSEHSQSHPFGVVKTLKIYETADIQGKVLREDPIGKTYVVVRKDGDFIYVEYDFDKFGYIYRGFLD
jgi:hypothetical protein